jgi:two-component system, sensor histidine kinase RegB
VLEEDALVRQTRPLRLNTLVGLRWLAVAGQTVAIVIGYFSVGLIFPIVPCLILVAASAALNLALRWRFALDRRLSERAATILLAYDVLQLAGLLFFTGGIVNPFAILFLAPVTIAAASLALRQTLGLLGLALASIFIKRSGGALRFENAKPPAEGAVVKIHWPRQVYEQGQRLTIRA